MTTTYDLHTFPMPGSTLMTEAAAPLEMPVARTVIASSYLIDTEDETIAAVLLLNPETPFYSYAEVDLSDGTVTVLDPSGETMRNIVTAAEFYRDQTGCI